MMCCLLRPHRFFCPVLLFFLNFHLILSSQFCSEDEAAALIQFKTSFPINGDSFSSSDCDLVGVKSYPKTDSWKNGTDCCKWDGVNCDNTTSHVVGLDLSCSWLYGNFPPNSSLFHLQHLQHLNLAFNNFNDSNMSAQFGEFPSLVYLNLSQTSFSGQVSSQVSHLSKLVSLDLSGNGFQPIDEHTLNGFVHNLTELEHVFLDGINMSSVDPSVLANLSSSLASLSLNGCDLRGKFPENIFHLPNIKLLNLGNNLDLHLYLPEFSQGSHLEHLDLSQTSLSGMLPTSVGNLVSLKHLDLQFSNISGSIPTSLGNLVSLEYLSAQKSNLSGIIPASLGKLSQLRYLDLSVNHFSGQFPSSLTNLTKLEYLDMSDNQLEGPIPDEVTNFPKLITLYLSYNSFNGTTPSWLYTLPSLKLISIGNNKFSGPVKEFKSKSLEWINFGNNRLQGPIPSSISHLLNLTTLLFFSNNLTLEYDMLSKLQNLARVDLSYNPYLSWNVSSTSSDYTLPNLQYLYLASCNVYEFPPFLRGSQSLQYLDLSKNRISGKIPEWMWEVGKDSLTYLNLSHNSLVEVELLPWNGINFLDLRSNLIRGELPLPPSTTNVFLISNNSLRGEISPLICNASSLGILDLSRNNLSGIIPQCFGDLSKSVWMLNLRMNNLHGIIPPTFAEGCLLRNLNLNGNQLEGPLPRSIINCGYLEALDLGNNKINDTFPHWLGSLQELQVLVLQSNQFHGSIQYDSRYNLSFSQLQIFDLSSNYFTGSLPTRYIENFKAMQNLSKDERLPYMGLQDQYGSAYSYSIEIALKGLGVELEKIFTMLTSIDLSNNRFQGEIPTVFGKLHSLKGLNLSHNSLGGSIPTSIGKLVNLEWLDFSSNKLVGTIPEQLQDLTYLSFLNLSNNELVGQIPRGKQLSTFVSSSFEGNDGLCGFPLPRECINEPPSSLLEEDNGSESHFKFGWKVVVMGYGCGVVFGLVVGCVVFLTSWPKWFVTLVEEQQHKRGRKSKVSKSNNRRIRR